MRVITAVLFYAAVRERGRAVSWREVMRCPTCQLDLGVERRADELVVTYHIGDWRARCPNPDDPALCGNLLPAILAMLTDDKQDETGEQRQRRTA